MVILQYDHGWGLRYPRIVSEWILPERLSKKETKTFISNYEYTYDERYIRWIDIDFGIQRVLSKG